MTVRIALRLQGIDFREPAAYEAIGPELTDLFFEAIDGLSLAVVLTDDLDPVSVAASAAAGIASSLSGVQVSGVHDELVSTADIAARCDVAAESVRLWAAGKRRSKATRFPAPRQVIGVAASGKTMSLWAWRDVLGWVRKVIGIDPDEGVTYLDDAAHARLELRLTAGSVASAFQTVQKSHFTMVSDNAHAAPVREPAWNMLTVLGLFGPGPGLRRWADNTSTCVLNVELGPHRSILVNPGDRSSV